MSQDNNGTGSANQIINGSPRFISEHRYGTLPAYGPNPGEEWNVEISNFENFVRDLEGKLLTLAEALFPAGTQLDAVKSQMRQNIRTAKENILVRVTSK